MDPVILKNLVVSFEVCYSPRKGTALPAPTKTLPAVYPQAHCRLDTKVYKHTLRICNSYCFSTATIVARTHNYMYLPVLF
jgi:hypothetical protein